jgi:hypothetical protein
MIAVAIAEAVVILVLAFLVSKQHMGMMHLLMHMHGVKHDPEEQNARVISPYRKRGDDS